jgi:hypothetical protein
MRLRQLEKASEGITSEIDSTKLLGFLTIGTFNYVVKDPDCIRLSGQFWIKDQRLGIATSFVSSNLMALFVLGSFGVGFKLSLQTLISPISLQCFARTF